MDLLTFNACGELDTEVFARGDLGGVPFIDKKATLFRTGTHKGRKYEVSDIDKIVEQFYEPPTELDWTVPMQVDHSSSARDTTGNVRKLWREGERLMGRARYIGQQAIDNVESGVWRKLSVGLRPNLSLHHVAVTPHPYVLDAQNHNEEGQTMSADPTQTQTPPAPAQAAQPDLSAQFSEQLTKLEQQFAERTKALEAKVQAQQTVIDGQAQVMRFAALAAQVDTFSEQGRTVPVMREAELALLKTFSDEQLKLYGDLKAVSPAYVDFATHSLVDHRKPGAQFSQEDCDAEVALLRKERGHE